MIDLEELGKFVRIDRSQVGVGQVVAVFDVLADGFVGKEHSVLEDDDGSQELGWASDAVC